MRRTLQRKAQQIVGFFLSREYMYVCIYVSDGQAYERIRDGRTNERTSDKRTDERTNEPTARERTKE